MQIITVNDYMIMTLNWQTCHFVRFETIYILASLITSTTWSRDNANSLPSTAVQRGSQLDFRSIRLADAGTYICTAISSLGSGSLYVNLVVEGPPGTALMSW